MALAFIPNPGQNLNDTRAAIRGNFVTLQSDFGVNHLPYGAVNEGKHNCVTLPTDHTITGTNNLPATNSSEVLLYSAKGPVSGNPEIFFQRQSQGVASGFTITESTPATNGWTRLPSGIILKWGFMNIGGLASGTKILFPTGGSIPTFTSCFNVQMSAAYNSTSTGNTAAPAQISYSTPPAIDGFTITWSGGAWNSSTALYYLAIGI